MSTALRLTLNDYERMVEQGAFDWMGDRRLELIYGELREATPPGPTHAEAVSRLTRWTTDNTKSSEVAIRVQDPIGIPELESMPQPDIVWARPKSYGEAHPQPRDVLLVIEVASTSLDDDLGLKAELYAQAGIKDYWVVNLVEFCIEVFRTPKKGRYSERRTYQIGEFVRPLALPKAELTVSGLFSGTI
jgi:Uma2 family endonuclease